jgi:subtilisin-like proprotein convertase family protein
LGVVRIRSDEDIDGAYEHLAATFFPYADKVVGDGVRVATGDFNGDGNSELVTAAGRGLPVKIFALNPDGSVGDLIDSKTVFGSRGVFVAAGDIDVDGLDELITAAASGTPTVKTWHDSDADLRVFDNALDTFNAFGAAFHGGVRVAAGNTNNIGGKEIITASGPGGHTVKVWSDTNSDGSVIDNGLFESFNEYGSSFRGGLSIAAGQVESFGGGGAEIVIGPASGAKKVEVRTDTNADGKVGDEPPADSFFPYGSSWKQGVRVGAGDTDGSGTFVEVLTAPQTSGGSKPVKVYDDDGDVGLLISDNPLDSSFIGGAGSAGVYPAFGKVISGTYNYAGFPQTIADMATLETEINVPASAGKIRDLDVAINLFHSFDGDLDVSLTHVATGTSIVLFQDVGGTNEGFLIRLNDEAGTDISSASNAKLDGPISGTFNPGLSALLSVFDGEDASGVWRLTIVDDSGGDTGVLYVWGLLVNY